jgi:hypothetical protein
MPVQALSVQRAAGLNTGFKAINQVVDYMSPLSPSHENWGLTGKILRDINEVRSG